MVGEERVAGVFNLRRGYVPGVPLTFMTITDALHIPVPSQFLHGSPIIVRHIDGALLSSAGALNVVARQGKNGSYDWTVWIYQRRRIMNDCNTESWEDDVNQLKTEIKEYSYTGNAGKDLNQMSSWLRKTLNLIEKLSERTK